MELPKVSAHRLLRNLSSIFRIPYKDQELEEFLAQIEEHPGVDLPFGLSDLRVVHEAFNVIGDIVIPSRGKPLVKYLDETPDQPILVVDNRLQGNDSLFFARLLTDKNEITDWVRKMTAKPSVFVNTRGGDIYVAAPVTAFAP